ncbi:MAG TPA: NAD-dependent epimerase/dehydratase family protein [Terracidiphilus sp.]
MRVVIIGGTGHIGSYLTVRLYQAGHAVLCVCRGEKKPYRDHPAWSHIQYVHLDRTAEEAAGNFGERICALGADAVIDLTCYTPHSARQLVQSLDGHVGHLLHCGTVWVHGHSVEVPTTEDAPRHPFGDYGIRKQAIEHYLLEEAHTRLPVTVLHPGHLVGPGWHPINPQGNLNPDVFETLAAGRELTLPNLGMETVHHIHADDVAQAFVLALERRDAALGQAFHVVSPRALTLRGYAERIAAWFGKPADLSFAPYAEWKTTVNERDARITFDHIAHSPNCSIEKARRLLGYNPRYTSLEAVQETVAFMQEQPRQP